MAKSKYVISHKDKTEHKIVSYFVLRKLAKRMPLEVAKKLTYLLMASKELLDMAGLGTPEKKDIRANKKGIEEAASDIINKKPYRYKVGAQKILKKLLIYLHLKS
jgi:hypothetical protein